MSKIHKNHNHNSHNNNNNINNNNNNIHVSHILVEREYEALDVLRSLNEGKSFEQLAARYSKCSSAKRGGDLGEVSIQRLDADFADVALTLKPGEITKKPVRTRFGYHLIRREK